MTNASGALQWTYQWEPYGLTKSANKIANKAPVNPRQWLGEYADPGQYHMRARQYDPATGQFTSLDQGGSGSPYGYANANPLVNSDPYGADWWNVINTVHTVAEVTTVVVGVSAVVCAASVVCAPAAPVLGAVAMTAGVVAAGTGIALAVHECTSPKGNCASAVVTAALDTVAVVPGAALLRLTTRSAAAATARTTTAAVIDASVSGLRAAEQATIARLAARPEFAGRTFSASTHIGSDFADDLGRTYDAMGDGTKAQYFTLKEFIDSLDRHLLKGNDFTVIDMTGYSSNQIASVAAYVDGLPAVAQSQIVRIGF